MTLETGITFAGVAFLKSLSLPLPSFEALKSKCSFDIKDGTKHLLLLNDSDIIFHAEPLYSGSGGREILIGYSIDEVELGEEADWKDLFIGCDPDKTARYFKNRRLPSTVLNKNLSGALCVLSQTIGELHLNFFVDSSCRALRMIWINGKCRLVDLFAEPLAVFTAQTVMKF